MVLASDVPVVHTLSSVHCAGSDCIVPKLLKGRGEVKINPIKGDAVHREGSSGMLPRVSLPSQLSGHRVWRRGVEVEVLSPSRIIPGTAVQEDLT